MAYELIETIEVGAGGASSLEFLSIPQDGVDLLLVFSLRNTDTGAADSILLNFNSLTTNFSNKMLFGTGSSVSSTSGSRDIIGGIAGDGATASTFSSVQLYISNYASSAAKSWSAEAVTENNATLVRHSIVAGLWNNTSAITSVLVSGGYDFVQYSTASLFKIS